MTPTGKSLFIWQIPSVLGGDTKLIAQQAKVMGLSSVFVKVTDGVSSKHSGETLRKLANYLKVEGLETWVWGYQYGPGFRKKRYDLDHARQEGVSIAQRALGIGATGILLDPEIEFEETLGYKSHPTPDEDPSAAAPYAVALCKGVREVWSGPLGYCPFWKPSSHGAYPWWSFSSLCNFVAPQTYFFNSNPVAQLETCISQFKPYGLPVYPAGPVAGAESGWSATKPERWCKAVSDHKLLGAVGWCWDEMTPANLNVWAKWKV